MKVLKEQNGFKFGINDNPDVAHLPVERRYQVETPDGDRYSGNKASVKKLYEKFIA